MVRNREFVIVLLFQIVVVAIGIAVSVIRSDLAPVAQGMTGGLLISSYIINTKYRYREIAKLEEYVRTFEYGKESLELCDNKEGELSILKNTLYKLCMKLLHQKEQLNMDKTYLADALSDISHQLKTPLTSITVMADLLNQEELPQQKREQFLGNIVGSVQRMSWLVQALLKIARLDAESVVLKKENVPMEVIVKKACREFLVPMELGGIELEISGEEQASICCDQAWTVEAISNIVKNCMEHTEPGGKIRISYGDSSIYTYLEIKDTGTGIAKEDLPYIFERFYRGKNSSMNSVGIGLPLAKSIIIREKGTIDVMSKEGVGTKFLLKFYR